MLIQKVIKECTIIYKIYQLKIIYFMNQLIESKLMSHKMMIHIRGVKILIDLEN